MPQTFYPLRRLQKELAYQVMDGNQRLLQAYGDVLTLSKTTLGKRDFAIIERMAKEHLADFRSSGIPDFPLQAWIPLTHSLTHPIAFPNSKGGFP